MGLVRGELNPVPRQKLVRGPDMLLSLLSADVAQNLGSSALRPILTAGVEPMAGSFKVAQMDPVSPSSSTRISITKHP